MKACPLIFGILILLPGLVLIGFTFTIKGQVTNNPKIKGAKHFKKILKQAETDCPDVNHMDLTGAPYTSVPAAINTVLAPTSTERCRSTNQHYYITHDHCHASVFTPGYCGKCTAIGVHYEKYTKKDGWVLQKASSLGTQHTAPNSNEEWNGVSYVNQTVPKTILTDLPTLLTAGTQVNVAVPLFPPPHSGNKLYEPMTKTAFFDTEIIQRGGKDHVCYSGGNVATLSGHIGATGATDANVAGIATTDCAAPKADDVKITGYCLGKPDTVKRRVMGMFFHNTTTAATSFTPHKIPTLNKYACEEKNGDGTYSEDCVAKFIWFDKDTTSTNAEILQNASKDIDAKVDEAYAKAASTANQLRLAGAAVVLVGLILSILGCAL